ncbi:MAG TPA: response regulator, partial [Candidatus Binatia bacterium]|nr:response regulator [Candidatus Binatia bacterium]
MARPRTKVLVVDDDPATREGLAALLESWGYGAEAVADGKAALQLCEKELPHGIITDLMMPGMTGLEFLDKLGERAQR